MTTTQNDRARLSGAIALSTLASGAGVALMAASAWLLSRAAEHPPVMYLMVAIVGVRTFGLSRGVFRYLERLVGHDVALRRQARLRVTTYRALAARRWIGRRDGELLSRLITDVPAVTDRVVRVIIPVVSTSLVITGASIVMILISPTAGWVITGAGLLGAVAMPWWSARLSAASSRSLAGLRGQLASVVTEAGHAAPDVIAYGAGPALLGRVADADAALRRAEQRIAFTAGLATAGQLLATGVAVTGGLIFGAQAVAAGTVAPVELAVLVLTPLALYEVMAGLPAAAQIWVRSHAALKRVAEITGAASVNGESDGPTTLRQAQDRPSSENGFVRVTNTAIGWPGERTLIDGLDLEVMAGERVALVGPSGIGKTTVAATIMGLIPAHRGEVVVNGSVGYLAQDAHLFDTTVAENLRIGAREAPDARLHDVLDRVGLRLSLDQLVGEHGSRISGGEARRVALARLLLADHQVLIIDEPTEHLDRPTADALVDDLLTSAAGSAMLIITHEPELMARCDRVFDLSSRLSSVRE